jgi:hypothetical protein
VTPTRGTIAPLLAVLVGAWALVGDPFVHSPAWQIVVAGVFVAALALIGIQRSRTTSGFVDPFAPLAFPLIYVGFSFLAPLWLADVLGQPLRGLGRSIPIAPDTVRLLIVGVVGFAAGAMVRFRSRERSGRRPVPPLSPERVLILGRFLLLVPLAISAERVAVGAIHHRGLHQFATSPTGTLSALIDPTEISALVLILLAHRLSKRDRLMAPLDWVLVGALILVTGAHGSRGNAIAVLLLLTLAHAHRRRRMLAVVVGAIVIAVFGVVVLQYRSAEAGRTVTAGAAQILIGDMTVAAFSTGATAAVVPRSVPYAHGATLGAALERQLPSPIANRLFGPPDDTAARRFRQFVGFTNENSGIGYSIPAEGYLNFGRFGVFGICLLLGLAFAWAYARFDFATPRTGALLYAILVAVLPFGLRSDSLGLIKSILYTAIFVQLALVAARRPRKTIAGLMAWLQPRPTSAVGSPVVGSPAAQPLDA